MSQGGQNNIYAKAAEALTGAGGATNQALGIYGNVPTVAAGMSTYQNPFTQQVVDRAVGDIGRTAAIQTDLNRANAAKAGAFGGARHGLVDAATNAEAQRAMGDLSAQLNMQGFNTAAQLAQGDISNRMAGASGLLAGAGTLGNLGTAGFNMGNTIQNQQWQQGLAQQEAKQRGYDDAAAMFYGYANSPLAYLQTLTSALSGSPLSQAQKTTSGYTPGILDFLSLGTGIAAL